MSPPQNTRIFPLFPRMPLDISRFNECCEIDGIDITDAPVLGMASSNNKELVSNDTRRVKSATTWSDGLFMNENLFPLESLKIENPQIIHIGDRLSTENNQVGID